MRNRCNVYFKTYTSPALVFVVCIVLYYIIFAKNITFMGNPFSAKVAVNLRRFLPSLRPGCMHGG